MKYRSFKITKQGKQKGASLIVTIVVLLALTVAALAMTSSNQTQSIMARNNQFRLESFNVSFAEIDSQLAFINQFDVANEKPARSMEAILYNTYPGFTVSSEDGNSANGGVDFMSAVEQNYMERKVAHEYDRKCHIFGEEKGSGKGSKDCLQIKMHSESELENTSIGSDQRQLYTYLIPKDNQS